MIPTARVGDSREFRCRAELRDGLVPVTIDGATVEDSDGTDLAVVVSLRIYVNRVLVLTPTPLYNSDTGFWYAQVILPRAGDLTAVWKFDVGGFIRRAYDTLKVEQGLT